MTSSKHAASIIKLEEVPAIGPSYPRLDAFQKVTGETKFAADYYEDGMVWAGVKRAGIPHAKLNRIFTADAEKIPGIIRVLTYKNISGSNRQGVVRRDQPVLVDDKIRHCGDAVALVLADDKASLRKALESISFTYDELEPLLDPEAAVESSVLVHEQHPEGNILLHGEIRKGSADEASKECDILIEACFETQRQEHAYLETEVGWAQKGDDGRIVIVCSTQTPFRDRSEVAEAVGIDMDKIRIVAPFVGGAFGGKDGVTVQSLLALAALHSDGRPVKMWWNREESFVAGTKRHSAKMYYRLGAKTDGALHYLETRLFFDTGPYDHLGGVVISLALEHCGGAYKIPNTVLKGWAVYTNNPIGGAFRGFGVPQVTAAIEQMLDMLAERLHMDPSTLRSKNILRQGDTTCVGKALSSPVGIHDCLEKISEHEFWKNRETWKQAATAFKKRGVGIAALIQGSGYGPVVPDYANAKVELTPDGKIRIYCGVVDMGQGNAGTNAQICASILGQPLSNMELILPDTDKTLPSGSASASRCTYTFGNALIGAANLLKSRIIQKAADLLMVNSADEIAILPDKIKLLTTGREFPLRRLAQLMNESERTSVSYWRAPVAKDNVAVSSEVRLHGIPHTLFSFGAHMAAVEVDELTGAVEVVKYTAVSDCGKIINPQLYHQQIHGAVAQGIGYALCEDFIVDQGRSVTKDLSTYLVPTCLDIPDIESLAVEIYEPTGPFGLKGVGEVAVNGPLPAIANAVADACGVRVFQYPMTPERILKALRSSI